MSKLPVVPLKKLPLFEQIDKSDLWYGLIPEFLDIQMNWIRENFGRLKKNSSLEPYFQNAIALLENSIVVAGNGHQYFAVHALRAILERVALFHASCSNSGIDTINIIANLKKNDLKIRKRASQDIMDFAKASDADFQILYDMLSRYYGHISHLDTVKINNTQAQNRLLVVRSQILPILLIFDVGQCFVRAISALLVDQGKPSPDVVAGRNNQISVETYMRVAAHVMCEKHSKGKAISLSTLYSGIKDVHGQVGITDIYRGGMDVYRYGDPKERPQIKEIAGFSLFAIGKADPNDVKVKLVKKDTKGEKYQLSWPKHFEVDATTIAGIASQKKNQVYPLFDYVSDFIKAVNLHEKQNSKKRKKSKGDK